MYYISLVDAATQARWDLQKEQSDDGGGEMRVVDILRTMSSAPVAIH